MYKYRFLILVIITVVFALFTRNNAHAIGRHARPILTAWQGAPANGSQLRILTPKPGEHIGNDAVTLSYALQRTATVQSVPTYSLRLDANDVVQVADTTYTFTGLRPGNHTITVQVLDANGVPVPDTQGSVQFTVVAPSSSLTPGASEASTMPVPRSDALSILGLIGFGLLVGGALGVYRTNHQEHQHPRRRSTDR